MGAIQSLIVLSGIHVVALRLQQCHQGRSARNPFPDAVSGHSAADTSIFTSKHDLSDHSSHDHCTLRPRLPPARPTVAIVRDINSSPFGYAGFMVQDSNARFTELRVTGFFKDGQVILSDSFESAPINLLSICTQE